MAPKSEDAGITPVAFTIGSIVLILATGIVIWFAVPGADAKHKFVSPSGKETIELGEQCRDAACLRVAVREEVQVDGTRTRHGCTFEIPELRPMLLNVYPLWAPDERSVDIVYADADGAGGKVALDLERDCTITE